MPYMLNTYLTGCVGYYRPARLAGAGSGDLEDVEREPVRLHILRAALTKNAESLEDAAYIFGGDRCAAAGYGPGKGTVDFKLVSMGGRRVEVDPFSCMSFYWFSIDFVNLVPETGKFLHDYAGPEVRAKVRTHEDIAPCRFVSWAEEFPQEGTIVPLYDVCMLPCEGLRPRRAAGGAGEVALTCPPSRSGTSSTSRTSSPPRRPARSRRRRRERSSRRPVRNLFGFRSLLTAAREQV